MKWVMPALLLFAGGAARPPGGAGASHRHVVEIRGMSFQPSLIEVPAGDTVVWLNRDIVPHSSVGLRGEWDTRTLGMGESGRYLATRKGRFQYQCALHPVMRGQLVVR